MRFVLFKKNYTVEQALPLKRFFLFTLLLFPQKAFSSQNFFEESGGITGIFLWDYLVLPFLITLFIFIVFKKQIISLVKKIEKTHGDEKE